MAPMPANSSSCGVRDYGGGGQRPREGGRGDAAGRRARRRHDRGRQTRRHRRGTGRPVAEHHRPPARRLRDEGRQGVQAWRPSCRLERRRSAVKRFPAFDPPEYVDWKADPALVQRFRDTITSDPERARSVAELSGEAKLDLYRGLLRARLHDIQLKRWVRTGVLSKAWLGTGEEATTVGPVHALQRGGSDIVA